MLHLLGGPPRCGKTTFVARAAGARGLGWLSTDTVRGAVGLHMPLFEPEAFLVSHDAEADRFFSSFEKVASSCAYLVESYVIEGVGFYPRHVERLADRIDRRAVFVGQSKVDLDAVSAHAGRNAWHLEVSEADRQLLPPWIEGWSRELEAECAELGYPYVDLAAGDFAAGLDEVERLLFG